MIENLFSDDAANSPPEFEDPPLTKNISTTPFTLDNSPSPSPPPNTEPLPNPEPPISTPPDTHRDASSIQEAQTEIPPTNEVQPNEDQQLGNQPPENQPLAEQPAGRLRHKRKRKDKKKKEHHKEKRPTMIYLNQLGSTTTTDTMKLRDGELGQLLETLAIEAATRSKTR